MAPDRRFPHGRPVGKASCAPRSPRPARFVVDYASHEIRAGGHLRSSARSSSVRTGFPVSFASEGTKQKFPFPYDAVFDGLLVVLPLVPFKVNTEDRLIGRITATTGMSLFSWGENVTVLVEKVDEKTTLVSIESSLKLGINVAGAHRHAKNFNALIEALSGHLQASAAKKNVRPTTSEPPAAGAFWNADWEARPVFHDHPECPEAAKIPSHHRSPGTNNRPRCPECKRLSANAT